MTDAPTNSAPFTAMAERIDRNPPEEFGGAFVIVPPGGEPVTVLHLDATKNVRLFWSSLSARIAVAVKEVEVQADQAARSPWGQR